MLGPLHFDLSLSPISIFLISYHLDDIYEDCVDSIKWITSGKMNEVIAGKGKVDGSNMAVFGHS